MLLNPISILANFTLNCNEVLRTSHGLAFSVELKVAELELDINQISDCDFLFEIERRGNERGLFAIDRDGVVSLAAPLDRESSAKHVLRITVTDQRPPHKGNLLFWIAARIVYKHDDDKTVLFG